MFVAIAATPALDELALQRRQIQIDRTPQQRIDPLERDRIHMRGMDRRQRREVGRRFASETDPLEITTEVQNIRHRFPQWTARR